jgi:hypothetical protein
MESTLMYLDQGWWKEAMFELRRNTVPSLHSDLLPPSLVQKRRSHAEADHPNTFAGTNNLVQEPGLLKEAEDPQVQVMEAWRIVTPWGRHDEAETLYTRVSLVEGGKRGDE